MKLSGSCSLCSRLALAVTLLLSSYTFADSQTTPGDGCDPASAGDARPHPNLTLLQKLDIQNLDASREIIADNFVWHYFNPKLPELHGDYHGLDGFKDFFTKLKQISSGSFQARVIDRLTVGEELVIIQTCNRLTLEAVEGATIETDVIVVWRIVDGQITEGWDIPSIHAVRVLENE